MAEKNSFVLFYELEEQTSEFSDAQLGQLLRAVFEFEIRGNQPEITDVAVRTAFRFVAAQLNRSKVRYEETCIKRQEAGRKGGRPPKPKDFDKNQKKQMVFEETKKSYPDSERESERDSDPEHVPDCEHERESAGAAAPPPAKPERHKRGAYGWVKLSDVEYSRLLNELGQTELERCITYVDESAQATGNKNKWRDWNLVIRRCSKQGWGLTQAKKGETHGIQKQASERDAEYYTQGFHRADE